MHSLVEEREFSVHSAASVDFDPTRTFGNGHFSSLVQPSSQVSDDSTRLITATRKHGGTMKACDKQHEIDNCRDSLPPQVASHKSNGSRLFNQPGDQSKAPATISPAQALPDKQRVYTSCQELNSTKQCPGITSDPTGGIQGYGVVVGLERALTGNLLVAMISDNSEVILGYTPSHLFGLENFTNILEDQEAETLHNHVASVCDCGEDPSTPDIFDISIQAPGGRTSKFLCVIHADVKDPNFFLCEFEPQQGTFLDCHWSPNLSKRNSNFQRPNAISKEISKPTNPIKSPLQTFCRRRSRQERAIAIETLDIISEAQDRMVTASTLEDLLHRLLETLKNITGHDAAVLHRFNKHWNGWLAAQSKNSQPFEYFPDSGNSASCLLSQECREIYGGSGIQVLFDRDQGISRLLSRPPGATAALIDTKSLYLRLPPKLSLEHFNDETVRSYTSIPLKVLGKLWGVVTCHSSVPTQTPVSFLTRGLCRFVGDSASRQIENITTSSFLEARGPIIPNPDPKKQSTLAFAAPQDLLSMLSANFAILSINGETRFLESAKAPQEALALIEYFRSRKLTDIVASLDIPKDFPDLQYAPGFHAIQGFLYSPLSPSGENFVLFCREVQSSYGTREWSEKEFQSVAIIRIVYSTFSSLWKQKERALAESRFCKLLVSNSGHEFRTLLNAITNYLEFAGEGRLNDRTNEALKMAKQTSQTLLSTVTKLLDFVEKEVEPCALL